MTVYVTADWSRVVPEDDPEAAFGVAETDIDARGLRKAYDEFMAPPEPTKQAKRAADKMARRHEDK